MKQLPLPWALSKRISPPCAATPLEKRGDGGSNGLLAPEDFIDLAEETGGMMLQAAAPVFDQQNNLIGVIYGGVLVNHNYEIVDKIKQTAVALRRCYVVEVMGRKCGYLAMMSGLAVVGLILRPQSRVFRTVSWISLLLLVIYLLNTLFLYLYGS